MEFNNVLNNGVFFAATKAFGVTFAEREDLIAYHPDARVFEVSDDGSGFGFRIGNALFEGLGQ